jgi:hypothetical protein
MSYINAGAKNRGKECEKLTDIRHSGFSQAEKVLFHPGTDGAFSCFTGDHVP